MSETERKRERERDIEQVFARFAGEIQGGLDVWGERVRWDTIHLAGKRDTAPATIFDKILAKVRCGTYRTVKARIRPWLSGSIPCCSLFVREKGRWGTIHLAGKCDTSPDSIFDKILAKVPHQQGVCERVTLWERDFV